MEPEPEPRALPWQDDAKQEALAAQWLAFDAAGKAQIKNAVFGCLGSSQRGARDVAAQVVSAAATIELPRGEWLDVIQARVRVRGRVGVRVRVRARARARVRAGVRVRVRARV